MSSRASLGGEVFNSQSTTTVAGGFKHFFNVHPEKMIQNGAIFIVSSFLVFFHLPGPFKKSISS